MTNKLIIGVDIGGTKIAAAISDSSGNILSNVVTPTEAKKGGTVVSAQVIKCIQHVITDTHAKLSEISSIVLGIPGQIDSKNGIVINAPNINGWQNFNLKDEVSKGFSRIPIILENDAHCAAMGEIYFGSGKEYNNVIFMVVSTGVGGGIIFNKKLYSGENNIAGEIGHMALNLVSDGDYPCGCGRNGCLEAYASGVNMAKRAQKRLKELHVLKENYGQKLFELAENQINKITSLLISQAAADGDQFCIEAIHENADFIGIGCANLIHLLDPEAIIIGGGVSKIGDLLFDRIRETTKANVSMTKNLTTALIPATTGTDAGIYGTLAIGISNL